MALPALLVGFVGCCIAAALGRVCLVLAHWLEAREDMAITGPNPQRIPPGVHVPSSCPECALPAGFVHCAQKDCVWLYCKGCRLTWNPNTGRVSKREADPPNAETPT